MRINKREMREIQYLPINKVNFYVSWDESFLVL